MASHPTIKDVAKKAGVSITTVSFVLNRRPGVTIREAVKKRVLEAARELHYHPSALAAGLAGRRTRNLGLVFYQQENTVSNQFYSFIVEGIIKETMEREYNLLFSYRMGAYGGYQDLPKAVREKNVDGVLFMNRVDPEMVKDIRSRKIAVVLIDNFPSIPGVDSVQIDNRKGAALAVEHLAQLGHRQIGMLVAGRDRPSVRDRERGFREACERLGLSLREEFVVSGEQLTFGEGYDQARALLKRSRRPTALFCANDEMAAGALRAAREAGFSVPEDLSVVGFDNITMANYTDPPLTTVSVPKEYLGKLAVLRLVELVEKKDKDVKTETVPVELQVRGSTGKVGSK